MLETCPVLLSDARVPAASSLLSCLPDFSKCCLRQSRHYKVFLGSITPHPSVRGSQVLKSYLTMQQILVGPIVAHSRMNGLVRRLRVFEAGQGTG